MMSKETFKAAKLAALKKYREQAFQDINNAKTKRKRDNAIRRFNLSVEKELQYATEFWTAEMEWTYNLCKNSDDVTAIPAM